MTSTTPIDWKEVRVDTFRAGGPGGQYQNKTDSAVRMTYQGISVVSRSERSQLVNKRECERKLMSLYEDSLRPERIRVKDEIKFGKSSHTIWEQDIKDMCK